MSGPVVIENPVINSPFEEPRRHFKFGEAGISNEIEAGRRGSCYFIPIPRAKKKGAQQAFEDWTADRIEENHLVNQIRAKVKLWREGRYIADTTRVTARLVQHWRAADRETRLFFCQIEAMETVIYLAEVARKYGDHGFENLLRQENEKFNPGLYRLACKLATGAGKTVVMAMVVAWQTLNKLASPQDARFGDAFLICAPGITIRDRLRVLLPSDPGNYYKAMGIVPSDLLGQMNQAKVVVTNFHGFLRREKIAAGRLTKELLRNGEVGESAFTESEGEMVRRVCRGLGNKKNIVVINDEAHHCYRRKAETEEPEEKLAGDERREAEARNEEARVWISGLEAVQRKIGVKAIYDLSATPFFLRGSGYGEGTLFPWVVSDFSLIDSIESGIVKVPRVPVADDSMVGDQPTYRELWYRIRDSLPKKGRGTEDVGGEPKPPMELEGAIQSLYGNYKRAYERWEKAAEKDWRSGGQSGDWRSGRATTPPVFIVVCNNTNVSKMVFDFIAGWEKQLADGRTVAVPGKLALFSNVKDGRFTDRPATILVDSQQLESEEGMSAEFKAIAAREIAEFKAEFRIRFPDRDPEKLTDEDLLREVLNTVGKPEKLGEHVKCVVSVSMLTEGWDANTVTHILGVRAFGTQLLCEQVVGRGLRRRSYEVCKIALPRMATTANQEIGGPETFDGFETEYAEVYGVPFSFIPCSGAGKDPKPGPMPTRVRALAERAACEILFPRIDGYRYELPAERLTAKFAADHRMVLSTQSMPTKTEQAPVVGETELHTLDDYKKMREQTVGFEIAKTVLEKYFSDADQNRKEWLFPDLVSIVRRWMEECVTLKDHTFMQLLLWTRNRHEAADRIYRAIVTSTAGPKQLLPIPKAYDVVGSTRYVDFDTTRPTYRTRADKCHISHVVCDTDSWEQKMAQVLEEDIAEVAAYAKNQNLGFFIPYTLDGEQGNYMPDFLVRVDDGHGKEDLLNLIVEVSGERDRKKEAKVATARTLWVPAVNNAGTWGRWGFVEVTDPWDAGKTISGFIGKLRRGEEMR